MLPVSRLRQVNASKQTYIAIKGLCEPTGEYEMLTATQYGVLFLEIKCNDL